jgi:hypothetical protein
MIIEDQAVLRSDNSAPFPTPFSPLLSESCLFSCVSQVELTDGRGGGEGVNEESNHIDQESAWSFINLPVISGDNSLLLTWCSADIDKSRLAV